MKNSILYFTLVILLYSCGKEVPEREIYGVRSIGTLSTSEYTLGKIVKMNDEGEWYKFGDRKILISCKATVKAGVNLKKIKDEDIKVEGNKISITLPAAEIISFEMSPENIKTEANTVNGFRSEFSQEDKIKILQKGEKSIREDLKKLNILKDAQKNANSFIRNFYQDLGFTEIVIYVKESQGNSNASN